MDELMLGVAVLLVSGSLPCIVLGYLIAVKQQHHLIAGWNEAAIADPKRYAKSLGYSVFALGIAIGLIAFSWYAGFVGVLGMSAALLCSFLGAILFMVFIHKKYKS